MLPDSCTILPIAAVKMRPRDSLGCVNTLARLRESITRHAGEGRTQTALPSVSVICSPTITEPLGDVIEPTLSVIAQGMKETALSGRTFTYGPGQFLVVSVDLPVIGHITHATVEEPFLAVVLELRPERISALLLETAPAATGRPGAAEATPAGIAVSDASPALIDAIGRRRLCRRLRQPLSVQPRVPAHVRRATEPRRARNARGRRDCRRSSCRRTLMSMFMTPPRQPRDRHCPLMPDASGRIPVRRAPARDDG
jgi:AraC-type transcriptional regulator N-terminus